MQAKDARIVFMGTPALAAYVLQELVSGGYNVVAVVTAPDKPAGRGRKLSSSPVKECALKNKLTVLQPENLKSPDFIRELASFKPDLQVVVAFRMLPEAVWSIPPFGTFNLHASLLPQYRGAAPINHVIMNGESVTGVTTFLLDHQIDTGNILYREPIIIQAFETAGTLHDKVQDVGSRLVIKTIDALIAGDVQPINQEQFIIPGQTLQKAPKIFRQDCKIQWDNGCQQAVSHIHGLSPWPGAFTPVTLSTGKELDMKVFEARPVIESHHAPPGKLLTDNKSYIHFTCPDGYVKLLSIQLPGKKRMGAEELLRGFQF